MEIATNVARASSISARRNIPALTMARFVAAIGVVWYHYGKAVIDNAPQWFRNISASGGCGVTFFFILSGFILVYVSHGQDIESPVQRQSFWLRRVARIYPVYVLAWLLFGVVIALNSWHSDVSLGYFAKVVVVFGGLSLLLLQCWVPNADRQWNWPGWSLSCEAFFYLCFPFVFAAASRLRTRSIWIGLIVFIAAGALSLTVIPAFGSLEILPGTPFASTGAVYFTYLPPNQFIVFMAGVMLGQLYVRGVVLPRAGLWSLAAFGAVLTTLSLPLKMTFFGMPRDVLLVSEFCLLIYGLAHLRGGDEGPVGQTAVLLGNASYTLYILQSPVWALYWIVQGRKLDDPKPVSDVLLFCVVLTAVSVAIYHYFERPMERWIKRRFSPTPSKAS